MKTLRFFEKRTFTRHTKFTAQKDKRFQQGIQDPDASKAAHNIPPGTNVQIDREKNKYVLGSVQQQAKDSRDKLGVKFVGVDEQKITENEILRE